MTVQGVGNGSSYSWNGYNTGQGIYGSAGIWSVGSGNAVNVSLSGTLVTTFYWIPDPNNANDAPPLTITVKETSDAGYYALAENYYDYTQPLYTPISDINVTGSADDGHRDSLVTKFERIDDDNWSWEKDNDSKGIHLRTLPVTLASGTVPGSSEQYTAIAVLESDQSASAGIADTTPYGSGSTIFANVSEFVYQDNRKVTVSCPAVDTNSDGGSQYRDPALTGPVIVNQRAADGTLRGDTALYVVPQDNGDEYFTFSGSAAGSWSVGSTYHWYERASMAIMTAMFGPTSITLLRRSWARQ